MFARIKLLLAVSFLFLSVVSSRGQSPSPTPANDRGLGVQGSSSRANQTNNQQSREQKPELVLQTGYNSLIGGTRYLFSPDGRLLATGTMRSTTIKLWDTSNGRQLRDVAAGGLAAPGLSPVFAFSRDSRLIAGASMNTVKIWDVASGRELHVFETATSGTVNSGIGITFIDFTPDGRLVTISDAIRIWDVANGRELRSIAFDAMSTPNALLGGSGFRLNGDGSQLLVVQSTSDRTDIVSVDLSTGREGRAVKISGDEVHSGEIAVTPTGNLFAAGIVSKRLKLWDVANRSEKDLGPTSKEFNPVTFSRDGRLLAYSDNYNARIWDTVSGRELSQLAIPHGNSFSSDVTADAFLALSEDGKKISSGGFDTPSIVWDVATAKQLFRLNGRTNMAYNVMFSTDGNRLTSGGRTRWDLRTGRGLRIATGVPDDAFGWPSPDGRLLALQRLNSSAVTVLEAPSGRTLHTLTASGTVGNVQKIRFTDDSAFAIVSYMSIVDQNPSISSVGVGSQVKVWDLRSGKEVRTLAEREMPSDAVPSRDGRMVAMLGAMGQISLWDNQTGTKVRDLTTSAMSKMVDMSKVWTVPRSGSGMPQMPQMPNMADIGSMLTEVLGTMSAGTMSRSATSVAFSSDNRVIAVGGVESKSNIDVGAMMSGMTGQQQKKQKNPPKPEDMLKDLKVEPIGRVILWDAATGQVIATLRGHGKGVNQVAFSRDAKLLASAGSDNTIRIWDIASQRELRTMAGHTAPIESMDFSPDGRLLASSSDDGGTFLWDTNTGEHLLTLVSLDDGGEWMVVTPQGLFDGTPPAWNQILWRYNGDTFNVAPIEWFFNEFYYPGLLSDVFSGKRPRVAQDISKKDRRQPVVKLTIPGEPPPASGITQRTAKVKIEITDAAPDRDNPSGSGARDVRLFRNGSLVKVWRGDVLKGQSSVTLEEEVTITAGPNRLVAYGFNKDNVKSKDAPLELLGADSLKRKGTAYIIAVGINNYANEQYNLKYAVADAESFANEVRTRQNQIGVFERVEVISLLNENATKAKILSALQRLSGAPGVPTLKATGSDTPLKKIEPEDTVIIYFAGHGTAQAQRFYLIPHDLGYTGDRTRLNEKGLQEILSHSISDLEIEQMVEGLDAGHLLLVIDACNSGQALEAEEKRRGPMNSKGLAQLAYEKGMYILTAAQSYQAALEAAQLGHGLLTYALIEEGLKSASADTQPKDGILIAREWLDFATDRVPLMQEEKMKQARGVGVGIAFTEGEKEAPDQNKTVQRPRVFYRRELETNPLVIAKP